MPDANLTSSARSGHRPSAASLADVPDHRLVELARERQDSAFEALMRRYNRRLYRVARSVLRDASAAEDAVQDAYLRAFTHLHSYKPTGSFGAWLTRIALNEALMTRRRARREVSLQDIPETTLQNERIDGLEGGGELDGVATGEARRLLEHAVDRLPDHFRTVYVLREVEELSIADTAACLGLNAATVKTRLHRAQRRLRADIARRLERERSNLFDFDGARCDRIVGAVLAGLR